LTAEGETDGLRIIPDIDDEERKPAFRRFPHARVKQRYFFVEQFFETDFKKITPRPPMGTRIFDLAQVLNTETLPKTSEIAELLKTKDWS
jgi:hypothetical protein